MSLGGPGSKRPSELSTPPVTPRSARSSVSSTTDSLDSASSRSSSRSGGARGVFRAVFQRTDSLRKSVLKSWQGKSPQGSSLLRRRAASPEPLVNAPVGAHIRYQISHIDIQNLGDVLVFMKWLKSKYDVAAPLISRYINIDTFRQGLYKAQKQKKLQDGYERAQNTIKSMAKYMSLNEPQTDMVRVDIDPCFQEMKYSVTETIQQIKECLLIMRTQMTPYEEDLKKYSELQSVYSQYMCILDEMNTEIWGIIFLDEQSITFTKEEVNCKTGMKEVVPRKKIEVFNELISGVLDNLDEFLNAHHDEAIEANLKKIQILLVGLKVNTNNVVLKLSELIRSIEQEGRDIGLNFGLVSKICGSFLAQAVYQACDTRLFPHT